MAIPATIQWEFNTAGSNNNGGGFDSAAVGTGTDYSLSPTPYHTWLAAGGTHTNDLACTDATPSEMSSASHNFVTAEIGNFINITAGTSWTAGRYMIVSINGNNAVLDRKANVSTTPGSAGSGYLGGALAVPTDPIFEDSACVQPGHKFWLKENGDGTTVFTLGASIDVAKAGTSALPLTLSAYRTTRGESLIGAARPTIACAAYTFTFSGNEWRTKNFIVTCTTTTGLKHAGTGNIAVNCKSTNSSASAARLAMSQGGNGVHHKCEMISTNGIGLGFTGVVLECYAHNSHTGMQGSYYAPFLSSNIIASCSAYAIDLQSNDYVAIIHNTLFGAAAPTGTGIYGTTAFNETILYNIIAGFTTGINITTTYLDHYINYNNFYNNTTDRVGVSAGPNDIDADPGFVDAAGGDFTPGANCKLTIDWTETGC